MKKYNKLKEIVLLFLSIILGIIIIKYLGVINFFTSLLKVLTPVFIGFIYAWLFNPLIIYFSKKYKRNIVAVILFLILMLILGLFLWTLIPTIYKEINELVNIMPELFDFFALKLEKFGLKETLFNIGNMFIEKVPLYLVNFIKNLFSYIGTISIGLILGLYMSIDYLNIIEFIHKIVPKKYKCIFIDLSTKVSTEIRKCVNGTLFIASLVFLGDFILFFIIGLDAPLLIGLLCGITDLIPYIGPYIGGAIAVIVGFSESKLLGFLALIICVVVQSIENYILQPMVMSKTIKISPILIIVGLLVFGHYFGIVGMILATPIVAFIKVITVYIKGSIEKCK